MAGFASATIIQRRQILEDALTDILRPLGEIAYDGNGNRCLAVTDPTDNSCWILHDLWILAGQLEARLA
ncbi:hypothetical protein RSWS8N_18089 [Cereibacter sphaeroides WS8N]|uniref:hypothetical protein n=1 Tax=Cereibacter sphaeroides TaxID=1063 RepID=UPI00020B0321|nr:hypothetical protein [Cereibacter sphaeroides]EGJ20096.1 hypothetical protein RSWS8N_18089 [Cereibacter sphaeroides WS8N]